MTTPRSQCKSDEEYLECLRNVFAAAALGEWVRAHIRNDVDDLDKPTIARECYGYADAMLKARQS